MEGGGGYHFLFITSFILAGIFGYAIRWGGCVSRVRKLDTLDVCTLNESSYKNVTSSIKPKPNYVGNIIRAFFVGGVICLVGQVFIRVFTGVEHSKDEVIAVTQASMVLLGAILTDFGVYDDLGELSGMGAAVPITGFANTIVAAAIDFRREGWLAGLGCKMFSIAGPVLVYGIVSGVVVGILSMLYNGIFH